MSRATSEGDGVEKLTKDMESMELARAPEMTTLEGLFKEIKEMKEKMAERDEEIKEMKKKMAERDEENERKMAERDEEIKEMKEKVKDVNKRLSNVLRTKTGYSFNVGDVIRIPCLLPEAMSTVSWKHRRVANDNPTVIRELEGAQDLVIPWAKLGDGGLYQCETTLDDGRKVKRSKQVNVFVEAANRRAPHATGCTIAYHQEFQERHSRFRHSPLFFEHFQTFSEKTRKEWRWSEKEEEKSSTSSVQLPNGCAERLLQVGRENEKGTEAGLMNVVNPCLEEAMGCVFTTGGAKGAEAKSAERKTRSGRSDEMSADAAAAAAGSEEAKSESTKKAKSKKKTTIKENEFDDQSGTVTAAAAGSDEAKSESTKKARSKKKTTIKENEFDDRSDTATAAEARSVEAQSNEADGKAKSQQSSRGPFQNDGAFIYENVIVIFIIEGKLYVLTTGDPVFQVMRYYEDYREKLPPKWGPNGNLGRGGLFPSYAAALSGNKLILFGVVTIVECVGERSVVEKISFCELASVDLSHTLQPIQEFLSNLRCAVDRLKKYYEEYKEPQRPEELIPSLPVDGVFNGRSLEFKEAFSNRPLMFYAKWGSDDVIVKFTDERYGEAVHEFCFNKEIAPELHGVKKVGPFQMVVMEKCGGEFITFKDAKATSGFDKEKAYESVKAALNTLYEGRGGDDVKYVHGDFRDLNVLINKKYEVKIIDFDWAGEDSKVTYPVRLNHRDIHWPDSAEIGLPILHKHDAFFLEKYFHIDG